MESFELTATFVGQVDIILKLASNCLTHFKSGTQRTSVKVTFYGFAVYETVLIYLLDIDEYNSFYTSFFKDFGKPLAWQHFSGDAGSGTAFKALIFLPTKLYVILEVFKATKVKTHSRQQTDPRTTGKNRWSTNPRTSN